ncbi:CGG triplet repeat-binding protein 1 [Rhizophagus irregularis DAOM 181602=DAOM 197198]|nr:CGG triplet repeat-binding protein 1 [Rhizophagus irregularis DAOM 181602=DAOM 197198]
MSKKPKTASVHTRCNEYKDIFRVDDSILFCNYCNISVDWKRKSTVDNHCKSQKHISNVKSQEKTQNNTQLTLSSTQAAAEAKKQLIEDLIEAFATADIPLEKVNSLLSFFKKYIKNGGSIPQAPTLRQNYLPNVFDKHFQSLKLLFDSKPVAIIMDETTDDCARSVVNTIFCYRNETKLVSVDFLEQVFVNSPARRGRYLAYLKMHGIFSPCKIPLYNKTRWNSWFRMVSYAKDHIVYWLSFFKEEFNNDKKHNTLAAINSCLENEQELGIITIYLNFITSYAKEFVQDLDFFQQLKKPVFPFVELRLQQLTAYIETYRNSDDFGLSLENLINSLRFNTHEFYSIFRAAFEAAYAKFAAHIPNHPARLLFHACQVFDLKFIHSGD